MLCGPVWKEMYSKSVVNTLNWGAVNNSVRVKYVQNSKFIKLQFALRLVDLVCHSSSFQQHTYTQYRIMRVHHYSNPFKMQRNDFRRVFKWGVQVTSVPSAVCLTQSSRPINQLSGIKWTSLTSAASVCWHRPRIHLPKIFHLWKTRTVKIHPVLLSVAFFFIIFFWSLQRSDFLLILLCVWPQTFPSPVPDCFLIVPRARHSAPLWRHWRISDCPTRFQAFLFPTRNWIC